MTSFALHIQRITAMQGRLHPSVAVGNFLFFLSVQITKENEKWQCPLRETTVSTQLLMLLH